MRRRRTAKAIGIDVDCLPLADVPSAGSDPVIGDRAYGDTTPIRLPRWPGGRRRGLHPGGFHPGARDLARPWRRRRRTAMIGCPVVQADRATLEAVRDFAAFRPLAGFHGNDCACCVHRHLTHRTGHDFVHNGARSDSRFDRVPGSAMSDDVSMKALSGTIAERSRAAFAAGCDVVLHCNGDLGEMAAVAGASAGAGGRGGQTRARPRWRSARRRKNSTSMPRARCSRRWWTPSHRRNGRPVHERLRTSTPRWKPIAAPPSRR